MSQYPTIQDWFAIRDQRAEITGYANSVKSMSGPGKHELLAKARKYNEDVVAGLTANPGTPPDDYYFSQLNPTGNNMMGYLAIPDLNLFLPVYHTVEEIAISRGTGHIFGSTLPVGGPTTHAVLASHSGLVDARLFTHLKDLDIGAVFSIEVLDQTIYYKVVEKNVVLPEDVSLFDFDAGKDYVTLVTCTPTGVNSHRLLVTGERLDPPDEEAIRQTAGARDVDLPFPWWMILVPTSGATGFALVMLTNRRRWNYIPVYEARAENARAWGATPASPFGTPLSRKQMNLNGKLIWDRIVLEHRAQRRGARYVQPKRPNPPRRHAS